MPRDKVLETPELTFIPIIKIKFDSENPNVMTDGVMNSLRASMEEFGFLQPIIVNKNFKLIDGEHRVRIYQEYGIKQIRGYVLNVTDVKARLIRQGMNKIKGEHDKAKDANDLAKIVGAGFAQTLAMILNKSTDTLTKLLSSSSSEVPLENNKVEIKFDIQHRCIVPGCLHGKEK